MTKMTEIVKGKNVNPYACANISNDDYTTYPVDTDGNVTQVDVIENGKLFKFITPANAKARMDKQMVDNLKVGNEVTDVSSSDVSEPAEETPNENVPSTDESESTGKEPTDEESTTGGETGESGSSTGSINANVSYD